MTDGREKKVVIEDSDDSLETPVVGRFSPNKLIIEEIEDTTPITVSEQIPQEFGEFSHVPPRRNFLWRPLSLIISGTLLISGSLLVQWLIGLIKSHRVMAIPVGLGLAILFWGIAWLLIMEIRSIYELRNAEKLQSGIIKLSDANAPWSDAAEIVRIWKPGSDSLVESQLAKVIGLMEPHDRASKFFEIFENNVIGIMDERAVSAIHNSARDIFFLTAVAPKLILDTVIFMIRSSLLVRQIAFSYGVRPGPIARARLVREALKNVAVISLTDIIVADAGAATGKAVGHLAKAGTIIVASSIDQSGALASTASALTGVVGEFAGAVADDIAVGLVSARRIALFGLLIIAACRPTGLTNEKRTEMGKTLGKRLFEFRKVDKSM